MDEEPIDSDSGTNEPLNDWMLELSCDSNNDDHGHSSDKAIGGQEGSGGHSMVA